MHEIAIILDNSDINLLYRYIEYITSQPNNTLNSWRSVVILLQDADYKKSHFTKLRTKIKKTDAEILEASLRDLGFIVKTDAEVRGSAGMRFNADIVAVLEGKCDLGWILNTYGSFDLVVDVWGVSKKYNQTELINSIHHKLIEKLLHSHSSAQSP
ncbi:MAG: DUF1257 domain-containing protein [Symploca sp. SIO3E6]|nr:DUF1257 domain-containing protein [Caldora sp. SIO3E6]